MSTITDERKEDPTTVDVSCPRCECKRTRVLNVRIQPYGKWRRVVCTHCGHLFTKRSYWLTDEKEQ